MQEFYSQVSNTSLFRGLETEKLPAVLSAMQARKITCEKGSPVVLAGSPAVRAGIVLSGRVQIVSEDYFGNRSITAEAVAGETFAEVFACAGLSLMPVSVFAAEKSTVLLLDLNAVINAEQPSAEAEKVAANLLHVVSQKTLALNRKISVLSRRSTREKLLAYLSAQAQNAGSDRFAIPFDRQELADYLCVDRSAMSAALSRMKKDGLIDYHKNHFRLL